MAVNRGWIRVSPNGRYLQFEDGTPFYSVGHGEAFGFFFQKMNPKATLEAFLAHMAAHGQNTLLCQVESEDLDFYGGHRLSLEGPLGHYDEKIAAQFDELLELARQHGIYVITYLWDTFHMDFAWEKSPYNKLNGGPCVTVSDMLRSDLAREWQKKKFAWAIDRWGNHPNLLAWELMNEIEWAVAGAIPANEVKAGSDPLAVAMKSPIDGHEGHFRLASAEEMDSWVSDMGAFTRQYARDRWGKAHLQTVSTNNPTYVAPWMFSNPQLDFLTNHQYFWEGNLTTNPKHPLDAAGAIVTGVRDWLARGGYRKPYMDTESGPLGWHLEHPQDAFPLDAPTFLAMSWANWAAGAAGAGMRWPYPNFGFGGKPYLNPLTGAMEGTLAAIASVSKDVAWTRFDSRPAEGEVSVDDPLLHWVASKDSEQLVGWLAQDSRRDGRERVSASLSFTGFAAVPLRVRWYDAASGALLAEDAAQGPGFALLSPSFSGSLAVVVGP